MSIRRAFREYLGTIDALTALVPLAKMFPGRADQGTTGAHIVLLKRGSQPDQDLDDDNGLDAPRFDVVIYAERFADCDAVFEVLRAALHGKGDITMGDPEAGGVLATEISLLDDYDGEPEQLLPFSEERLYSITAIFEIQTGV